MGPDGFVLRETVAEYVEILTLTVGELASELGISVPKGMPQSLRVRIFGGGPLVFDEYGQVKYQIRTTLEETDRQTKRLKYLWETGYFDRPTDSTSNFAALHLAPRWIRRLPMSPNLKSPKSVTIRSYHVGVRR